MNHFKARFESNYEIQNYTNTTTIQHKYNYNSLQILLQLIIQIQILWRIEAEWEPLQSKIWMTDILKIMKYKMIQLQLQLELQIQIGRYSNYLLRRRFTKKIYYNLIQIVCFRGSKMGATSKQDLHELWNTKLYKYDYNLTQIQLQLNTNTTTTHYKFYYNLIQLQIVCLGGGKMGGATSKKDLHDFSDLSPLALLYNFW